jgi:glycosyltransferase involved in cell wall biosynthesis
MNENGQRILVDALSVTSGGGHSYAVNLIKELDRDNRGFRFTFAVPTGALSEIPTTNVTIRPVRLPDSHPALRLAARFAYEELILPLRALRYDAVYAIADLASPLIPVPTVVALRNLNIYDHSYDDTLRLRTLDSLVRLGVRRAARMVFPSHAAANLIGERLGIPSSARSVVPHGVDTEAFAHISRSAGKTRYLFLPAAVDRHKNLEVLVEAIPHFSDPELEIRVAGSSASDSAYKDELLAKARRLGVENRFILLGPVPYEQVVSYYRGALALVFPSFLETFGHPMLEAMITGTPIVASEIPAFRELGEDVALFFPPADPIALARAVDLLLAEPASTAERVSKGRERAASFSWKNSTDTLCAVFDEILSE